MNQFCFLCHKIIQFNRVQLINERMNLNPVLQKRKSREADDWKARKARWAERAVPFAVGLAMVSAASLFYFYSRQGQKCTG